MIQKENGTSLPTGNRTDRNLKKSNNLDLQDLLKMQFPPLSLPMNQNGDLVLIRDRFQGFQYENAIIFHFGLRFVVSPAIILYIISSLFLA